MSDRPSFFTELKRRRALNMPRTGLAWKRMLIHTILGEKSRAISTLARLLEGAYSSTIYGTPITPALLRIDPAWDPLRADPAFQELCEEKRR